MQNRFMTDVNKINLMMSCYGRFNSYRIMKLAMQDITELFQYAFMRMTHSGTSYVA